MSWDPQSAARLIATLRRRRHDLTDVEVKSAADGVPRLGPTLCAFGNMPEGGTIILGLDESRGFDAVGLRDVSELEQAVAAQARGAVTPPVQVSFTSMDVDGATVLFVDVAGLPLADRPCEHQGRAFLRQADGDYEMSEQERAQIEAVKLTSRTRRTEDAAPVDGTSMADLDDDLRAVYTRLVRGASRRLQGLDEETLLRRTGVVEPSGGRLTLAGLYALGEYPQQFIPSLSLTAAVHLPRSSGARLQDLVHLTGPLPVLLEDAMVWVERNTRTRIAYREDGHAADVPELPLGAVRELIANALVHRSLSPMSHGKRVDVRLSQDRLVISNPGGLYAITASQLGTPGGRSAPNEFLYAICHHLRGADGARLVEAEGGGIIEVREEMSEQHLAPPEFYDTGVSFTAVLHRPQEDDTAATPLPQVVLTPPSAGSAAGAPAGPRRSSVGGAGLPRHGKRVLALLDEPLTITQVVEGSGLTLNQARYTLRRLAAAGLVEMRGSQGDRGTAYARVT